MDIGSAFRRLKRRFFSQPINPVAFPVDAWTDSRYSQWLERARPTRKVLDAQCSGGECVGVFFSIIVPLYLTPLDYLEDLVESVLLQTYDQFELILVNGSPQDAALVSALTIYQEMDERVKVVVLEENRGIAGNTAAGVAAAAGDHVVLLDHDDTIEPHALFEYAQAIREAPEASFYYCDEDMFEVEEASDGSRQLRYEHPLFKPAFSLSLLSCKNYILHMLCFRRSSLEAREMPDASFDGAQDFKLIIDAIAEGGQPYHIPKVLYHWRISEGSTATNPDAKPHGKVAYRKCLELIAGRYWHSARLIPTEIDNLFDLRTAESLTERISIIVDAPDVTSIKGFLRHLERVVSTTDVEVIFTGQASQSIPTRSFDVSFAETTRAGGLFARLNQGARRARGAYLIFMDADCRMYGEVPLEQLILAASREWIGIVAPKTLYANSAIKGYGVALTADRIMPLYRGYPKDFPGYQCGLLAFQESSACGWQGMTISRELFDRLGAFDERFRAEIGAVDLCQRVRMEGLSITQICTVELMTADACIYDRYNNVTNAPEFTDGDCILFDEKWPNARKAGDPYFNDNLDQTSSYFQISGTGEE